MHPLQATDFQDTVTCAHVGVDASGPNFSDPRNPLSGPPNGYFSSQKHQKECILQDPVNSFFSVIDFGDLPND